MTHPTTILMTEFVTHDVQRFILERPPDFDFTPGQGVKLAIDQPEWRDKGRPFTPTSLPSDGVVEFIIKGYPEHDGVTHAMQSLSAGDRLLMSEPFGSIAYRGPGVFIAGGVGITPFIPIFRMLHREGRLAGNHLLYTSRTPADIVCEKELAHYLGERARFLCSREGSEHCLPRRIDRAYLEETIDDYGQHFYLCGPPPFVSALNETLVELGATPEALVFEG